MRDHLLELFAYDLWANTLWIDYLLSRPSSEAELGQMSHILGSQTVWLSRINGESLTSIPKPTVDLQTLSRLSEGWREVLGARELSEIIQYRRTTGEPMRSSIVHISSHVANHGTYHRGALRGIALNDNRLDFPDTDLIGFYLQKN